MAPPLRCWTWTVSICSYQQSSIMPGLQLAPTWHVWVALSLDCRDLSHVLWPSRCTPALPTCSAHPLCLHALPTCSAHLLRPTRSPARSACMRCPPALPTCRAPPAAPHPLSRLQARSRTPALWRASPPATQRWSPLWRTSGWSSRTVSTTLDVCSLRTRVGGLLVGALLRRAAEVPGRSVGQCACLHTCVLISAQVAGWVAAPAGLVEMRGIRSDGYGADHGYAH